MPRRGGRHQVLVKGAEKAMEAFKLEIARDLGLAHKISEDGTYHNFTTVEVGQIGGEMVRRIQAAGEFAIMQRYANGEQRLMPPEVLPQPKSVRSVTNNGNPTVHMTGNVRYAPDSGQQWQPSNNEVSRRLQAGQTSQQDGEPYAEPGNPMPELAEKVQDQNTKH